MADVKVRIIAVDEASEPLKKAGDEVEKVGKKAKEAGLSVESMGKSMLTIAGGLGLQMGLQAIVGTMKNVVVGSFELAAALEQTKVGFTTMLGSGEAAQGMLDELRDFAATTPFQFTDLTTAASRMIAMGTAAEDVIPTLTAVGDAAAGLGLGKAGIDRITLALGQMGAKGKIGGDDLRQLAEAGVPALRYLADAAGVSTGEMQQMIEKGIIPAAEGVKVLTQSMSNEFGGLMAEQSKTATGALSNLEDATATLGTVLGGMFLEDVTNAATGLAEFETNLVRALNAGKENKRIVTELDDAVHDGLITQEQANDVVEKGSVAARGNYNATKQSVTVVTDLGNATLLLAEADAKRVFESDRAADSTNENYTAVDKLVPKVDEAKDAILQLKEAAKMQADSFSTLSGASNEYESDTDNLAKKTAEQEKVIKDLTLAHGKNQAAILAGTGTIKDNSDAIDKSALLHRDLKQDVQQLNEKQAAGKITGDDYTLAMDHLNIKIREQQEEHGKLIATQGTGLTAQQLANTETGTYTAKLGEATTALALLKEQDLLLQTQTATRIKEGMILDLIKDAADGGLQEEEVRRIQGVQTAMGLQDDATITGMLAVQRGSTLLAEFRDTHAKEFEAGNVATSKSFGAAADYIGTTTDNKIIPTLKGMTESIKKVNTPFFELKAGWDGLNSKDVELRITTIRTELIQTVQAAKFGGTGPAMGAPLAGSRAGGGAVMGGAGAYLVGERGPELFNPAGTGGSITPNGALGRGGLAIGTLNVYGVQSTSELFNQLSKEARARGMQFAVN